MAKELPYFQFEPAEYLTGDVSFCSLAAQGLFTNLCSYYWQRSCELNTSQFLRRLNEPELLQELIIENVIEIKENDIIIKFLDAQFDKATKLSKVNSLNGLKGGRPKKIKPKLKPIKTQIKANEKPNESQTKGIREDKIIKEEIKEDNKPLKEAYNFLKVNSKSDIEVFEMQNKNSFEDYQKFINYFNNKVNFENIEFTNKKLLSRLKMLNDNWDKKPKKKYKSPTQNISF